MIFQISNSKKINSPIIQTKYRCEQNRKSIAFSSPNKPQTACCFLKDKKKIEKERDPSPISLKKWWQYQIQLTGFLHQKELLAATYRAKKKKKKTENQRQTQARATTVLDSILQSSTVPTKLHIEDISGHFP